MMTRGEFKLYCLAGGLLALAMVLPAILERDADMPTAASGAFASTEPDSDQKTIAPLKAVLAAGDASIPNFDNAVREMDKLVQQAGAKTVLLSSDPKLIAAGRGEATGDNIDQALAKLAPGPGEACLVFVTSHGSEAGLSMSRDEAGGGSLAPERLAQALDAHCRGLPTVAILSGCHSGTYVRPAMTAENRIVLTAARKDRVSFGCSADVEFTYFDECLLASMKGADSWAGIFDLTKSCVTGKEFVSGYKHSYPQSSFGVRVKNFALR